MKEMVFENRCIEKLEREYEPLNIIKGLEYDEKKRNEYFDEMENRKLESWNAIGIAFITIIALPLMALLI